MMMKRCACLAVFVCITFNLLLCAKEVEGVHWKYCKGEWEAKISNATVVPDPARAGQEINVLIQGEIGRVVQGGELDLKVLFHNIPVYKETDNLCDRLSAGCPASNNFNVDAKQKLPKFTLPGKYQLEITAKDTEKKSLVCMTMDLEIKGPAIF
mmetsp:Transcript_7202/g.13259  ORF Transcript_7202/g.13259 Transcript_7202/m.13259 type:complete len:154 (-) Transcript_7202:95-556(-)